MEQIDRNPPTRGQWFHRVFCNLFFGSATINRKKVGWFLKKFAGFSLDHEDDSCSPLRLTGINRMILFESTHQPGHVGWTFPILHHWLESKNIYRKQWWRGIDVSSPFWPHLVPIWGRVPLKSQEILHARCPRQQRGLSDPKIVNLLGDQRNETEHSTWNPQKKDKRSQSCLTIHVFNYAYC